MYACVGLIHFEFAGQSVELLLKCRLDAKRFLSPEHLIIGEIEDHLAQAYATMGKI